MGYTKCHNVNKFMLKKLLVLTTSIILAINGDDTLRPLGM